MFLIVQTVLRLPGRRTQGRIRLESDIELFTRTLFGFHQERPAGSVLHLDIGDRLFEIALDVQLGDV